MATHFPPVTKKGGFFLKADASAVCNALAMGLQFSLLSCHCSVIFRKSTVEFPTGP